MDWLESIIFGFICGLTEFLPVSAQAHEALLLKMFGTASTPLLRLVIHAAALLALYRNCAVHIGAMLREQRLLRIPPRRRKRRPDMLKVLDLRFLRTAAIVLMLGFFAYPTLSVWRNDLHIIAPILVLNGIIVYFPMHMPTGNKDARSMSQLDAVLLGLSGALAVIPGISRIGILTAIGIARGADREHSLNWALLLCIPALTVLLGMDVYTVMTQGIGAFDLIQTVFAAAAAFGGAWCAIKTMRFLAVKAGFSSFAYYCWGAALFSFIMYLTV